MLIDQDKTALGSKVLELGATDLLYKPVSPEELLARIREVMHLQACQDKRHQLEMLLAKAHTPDKLPVLQAMSSPVLINQKTFSGTCG